MKKTLPVYYIIKNADEQIMKGEVTFTTLSVEDHAALEGCDDRILTALTDARIAFGSSMGHSAK